MGNYCGKLLVENLLEKSCRKFLWDKEEGKKAIEER